MNAIFFDIETIPSQAPDARAQALAGVKPPGTLKKPESIAAWWAESGPAAAEDAYRRQALDPAQGEVCCVGYALDDCDPVATVRAQGESERDFLRRALGVIEGHLQAREQAIDEAVRPWLAGLPAYPVGFNVARFDAPFLRLRCWANRIAPPRWLPGPFDRAPKEFGDVMLLAAGPTGMISLDKVCRALGIASPKASGTDGSAVYDLWLAGDHEALARYCAGDVAATRACWHVMTGAAVEGEAWAA
ncbi:MAG: hypothetical protein ACOY5G_11585 [Pseudomonadota bacterium]